MAAALPLESERGLRCWRCGSIHRPAFFCEDCEAVQSLPSDSDFSSLLGFEGHPAIETGKLQERYYDLSRRLHPDRFAAGSPEELRASVQATALLNEAFRTLGDIETRGRWWLTRCGEDLGSENNRVPPELAALVFEVQEKVADSSRDPGLRAELEEIRESLTQRVGDGRSRVVSLLEQWPTTGSDAEARGRLKLLLSELSYLRTLVRDVQKALEA